MKKFWILIVCAVLSISAVGCGPDTSVTEPENATPAPQTDEDGNAGQMDQAEEDTVPAK